MKRQKKLVRCHFVLFTARMSGAWIVSVEALCKKHRNCFVSGGGINTHTRTHTLELLLRSNLQWQNPPSWVQQRTLGESRERKQRRRERKSEDWRHFCAGIGTVNIRRKVQQEGDHGIWVRLKEH